MSIYIITIWHNIFIVNWHNISITLVQTFSIDISAIKIYWWIVMLLTNLCILVISWFAIIKMNEAFCIKQDIIPHVVVVMYINGSHFIKNYLITFLALISCAWFSLSRTQHNYSSFFLSSLSVLLSRFFIPVFSLLPLYHVYSLTTFSIISYTPLLFLHSIYYSWAKSLPWLRFFSPSLFSQNNFPFESSSHF